MRHLTSVTGLGLLAVTLISCRADILTEFEDLDRQISDILKDPSAQGISEAMHFMNLYCMDLGGLSLKLEQDKAKDIMDDLIKLYKNGRPKFIDIDLNVHEIKEHLHVKDETLADFRVLQSDARSMWDEFVTSLVKKSDKPI